MADTHSTETYLRSPRMLLGDPVLGEEHLGEVAPGVKAVYRWRTVARYFGTKQALVAAGLAQPAWFPGEPGQKKSVGRAVDRGRPVSIHARGQTQQGPKYLLEIGMTDAEREKVESDSRRDKAAEARQKAEAARKDEVFILSVMADSPDKFRDLVIGHAFAGGRLENGLPNGFRSFLAGGYAFTQEAIDAYNDALINALKVLRQGAVVLDHAARIRAINEIRVKTAKTDDSLQTFLRKAAYASVESGKDTESC